MPKCHKGWTMSLQLHLKNSEKFTYCTQFIPGHSNENVTMLKRNNYHILECIQSMSLGVLLYQEGKEHWRRKEHKVETHKRNTRKRKKQKIGKTASFLLFLGSSTNELATQLFQKSSVICTHFDYNFPSKLYKICEISKMMMLKMMMMTEMMMMLMMIMPNPCSQNAFHPLACSGLHRCTCSAVSLSS